MLYVPGCYIILNVQVLFYVTCSWVLYCIKCSGVILLQVQMCYYMLPVPG